MLISCVGNIIYEHVETVYVVCQRNRIFLLYIVWKQI